MPSRTEPAFSEAQARLARRFKALAHPARLAIVQLLAERGECVCGEVVDDLPLAQSTVSQHLKAPKRRASCRGPSRAGAPATVSTRRSSRTWPAGWRRSSRG